MNRHLSIRKSLTGGFFTLLLPLGLLIAPFQATFAQGARPRTPSAPASPVAPTVQPNDKEYTESILKNTTETFFKTELVDHLPASDKIPTTTKIIGYPVGTPEKLTYTKDLHRYYRELAKASPRIKIFTAPERSEMGKEQLLVLVSDEANLAKLDRYKEITASLADPRKINDAEAQQLVGEGKAIYWASGSIHHTG